MVCRTALISYEVEREEADANRERGLCIIITKIQLSTEAHEHTWFTS